MLFPYLNVTGIREARFLDMIECSAHKPVKSNIQIRKISENDGSVLCDAMMFVEKGESGKIVEKTTRISRRKSCLVEK